MRVVGGKQPPPNPYIGVRPDYVAIRVYARLGKLSARGTKVGIPQRLMAIPMDRSFPTW
jgi:hypothetical protein